MALDFSSDLNVFFNDFAVDAVLATSQVIKVILDEPDQESLSLIDSINSQATAKTSDVLAVKEKDQILIGTDTYTVKRKRKIEDGLLSIVYLSKV